MKACTFLLAALTLALLPASAQQTPPEPPSPAWIQEFNSLPEATRKSYIDQFRKAEQLFAQKRTMECLFSLTELEKLYAGNPGLYNLRGACYIEIRNIEKALENFEKAQKLDPSNLTIQFNLAEAHYVNHDYARALKAFTELLPPFKDNPGMTPLLQFKRYICARKLDNRPLARNWKTCTARWTTRRTTTAPRPSSNSWEETRTPPRNSSFPPSASTEAPAPSRPLRTP